MLSVVAERPRRSMTAQLTATVAEFQNRVIAMEGLTASQSNRLQLLEAGREATLAEHQRYHEDVAALQNLVSRMNSEIQTLKMSRGSFSSCSGTGVPSTPPSPR